MNHVENVTVSLYVFFAVSFFAWYFGCYNGEYGQKDDVTTWKNLY